LPGLFVTRKRQKAQARGVNLQPGLVIATVSLNVKKARLTHTVLIGGTNQAGFVLLECP